jgi:glyoxylase-like metal-dependent hydrolase (beta-lactamase superfamily II)
MSEVVQLTRAIYRASFMLTPLIPLHVHLVRGERCAAWIDSGVKAMFPQLMIALKAANVAPEKVRFILHTHAHHDHIGCNAQMQDATGCLIAAPAAYAAWHTDFERHYQEFARPVPDLIPDTSALRDEVLSVLDAPRPVDIYLEEGVTFDLGGAVLEAISLPGHMLAEFGWLDRASGVLILGDAITGLDWPILHGHLSVAGYRQSLAKLKRLLDAGEVQRVLFAHFPPMSPSRTRQLIADAERYLAEVEATVIRVLASQPAVTLEAIWTQTCARLGRQREFRALSTVRAHLQDLQARGLVEELDDGRYALR